MRITFVSQNLLLISFCTCSELDEKHKELDQQREVKKKAVRDKYAKISALWKRTEALVGRSIFSVKVLPVDPLHLARKRRPRTARVN